METLQWRQHYTLIFQTLKGGKLHGNGGIWPKFKSIKALMHVLVTCNNKEVKSLEWQQLLSHYKSGRSRTGHSTALDLIWLNFEARNSWLKLDDCLWLNPPWFN